MVHLLLSSTKGNQGLRYFPYTGYLGLTPLIVEGVVRTKRDDDPRPLLASSITVSVRCYESRVGRVSILHSNVLADFTQVLWTKPDGQDHAQIEELEFPFRITIPPNAPGFSAAVFVDYRCTWRVEAVLNHAPIPVIGTRQMKHFELPLVRYDVPPPLRAPKRLSRVVLEHQTSKPRAPRIRYSVHAPTTPIGPLDIISIPVLLQPLDADCTIRSANVVIERRIQLSGNPTPPSSQDSLTTPSYPIPSVASSSSSSSPSTSLYPHQNNTPPKFNPAASIASDISSNPTITPHTVYPSSSSIVSDTRPLLPCGDSSAPMQGSATALSKVITNSVVGADSTGQFTRDSQGVWSKTITLQWPAAKSHSRWTVGESIQSELVSVKFFLRAKISVSSANGTETIELSEQELLVVSTNDAERQLALSRYNDQLSSSHTSSAPGRSKSKSPRRTRRDPDADVPPPPAPFQRSSKQVTSTGSAEEMGHGTKTTPLKPPRQRRPHTSAGPRDSKPFYFAGAPRPGTGDESVADSRSRTHGIRQQQARTEAPPPVSGSSKGSTTSSETSHQSLAPSLTPSQSQTPSVRSNQKRRSAIGSFFSSSPRIVTAFSGGSSSSGATSSTSLSAGSLTRSTSSSVSSAGSLSPELERAEKMREWEEELAKIEMLSRRSSDLLGFSGMKKRSAGVPQQQV